MCYQHIFFRCVCTHTHTHCNFSLNIDAYIVFHSLRSSFPHSQAFSPKPSPLTPLCTRRPANKHRKVRLFPCSGRKEVRITYLTFSIFGLQQVKEKKLKMHFPFSLLLAFKSVDSSGNISEDNAYFELVAKCTIKPPRFSNLTRSPLWLTNHLSRFLLFWRRSIK